MSKIIRYCHECIHYLTDQGGCNLTKTVCKPDDFCSKWNIKDASKHLSCEYCGTQLLSGIHTVILDSDEQGSLHPLCQNCFSLLKTCRTCIHQSSCNFETDPSPLPKYIKQNVQRGPMQVTMDVRNPERMKVTCKHCDCWKDEQCQKAYINYCKHYTQLPYTP